MLQLCKLSDTSSKPTCLVLWTILKHDPTSHLWTVHASDSVIYSNIAHIISLKYYYYITLDLLYADDSVKMSLNPSAFEFLSNPPKNNPWLIIRQKKCCWRKIHQTHSKILTATKNNCGSCSRKCCDVRLVYMWFICLFLCCCCYKCNLCFVIF